MSKAGFLLILFSLSLSAYSQELRTQQGDVYYDVYMYKKKYNAPEGSPYLDENFTPCKIDDISETQLVRFNALEGKVEVKMSSRQVIELPASEPHVLVLKDGSGKVYETHSYTDTKGHVRYSFFERIKQTENYTLYKQERIKYIKEVKAGAYKEAEPAKFKMDSPVYFVTDRWRGSDDLVALPSRQKALIELFPGEAKAIKNLIKSEKLRLDNSQDLIRILDRGFSQP